jgi:hypothetical protein
LLNAAEHGQLTTSALKSSYHRIQILKRGITAAGA